MKEEGEGEHRKEVGEEEQTGAEVRMSLRNEKRREKRERQGDNGEAKR